MVGAEIYKLAERLFPYNRSITGEGVRQTLADINDTLEQNGCATFTINEVPSGTPVMDWTVPKEWKIREAYIENEVGEKIVDFKKCNLHVVGYSTPVDQWVELDELKKHIYIQEDQPDAIPYVTSYYKERYGFCMSKNMYDALPEGRYHMFIDSELFEGSLTYGELIIPGESSKEIFFSTYICHPSMANNEISGPSTMVYLIKYVTDMARRRYTYRFVIGPETIGSITYLSRNIDILKKNVIAGYNLSCVGDNRDYSFVETRYGNTLADKVIENVLKFRPHYSKYTFLTRGSDERQYNAPGVDIPFVNFSRSLFGQYPEYHTSKDDMTIVSPEGFQGTYDVLCEVIEALEHNCCLRVKCLCEPQLGKRNLYPTVSRKGIYDEARVMTNFIAYSDGSNDLIDISERINAPVSKLIGIMNTLLENSLLEIVEE